MTELQDGLQRLLDELVKSGRELGLQAAVYVEGQLVADVWAGDMKRGEGARTVDGDTLFTSWSTTKGFVATCLHILADRKQVDYNTPVAQYWPEFGCRGKEVITVRQALNHTAGIPQLPAGTAVDSLSDWDGMCAAIAELEPLWEPGVKAAYHALTFGWIIGELVRRVDGRSISAFAREELCELAGVRILSADRVAAATALQTDARDEVMEVRNSKALGYMLGGVEEKGGDVRIGSTGSAFGHPGLGGSIGFADPGRAMAVGFTKNLMTNHADRRLSAAYLVGQVARDWVDGSR